jgi:hypothetical protein
VLRFCRCRRCHHCASGPEAFLFAVVTVVSTPLGVYGDNSVFVSPRATLTLADQDKKESTVLFVQCLQEPFHRGLEIWHVARRRFPDDVGVDVKVPVHQDVPHPYDV